MAGSIKFDYYDPFFSESKILLNNVFIICNLGGLLLILHQIYKLSFKTFLPEYIWTKCILVNIF